MRLLFGLLLLVTFAFPAMASDPCMGMKVLEDSYAKRAADLNNAQRMAYGDKQADMHAKRLACEAAAAKAPKH